MLFGWNWGLISKIIFAKFIAKNNKEIQIEYQDRFEKEYKEQNIEQKGLSLNEYIVQKTKEYADEMYDKAYEKAIESYKAVQKIYPLKDSAKKMIPMLKELIDQTI